MILKELKPYGKDRRANPSACVKKADRFGWRFFGRQRPPRLDAGDAAVGKAIWPTLRCGFCHGEDGTGLKEVPSLRGTDVSFEKFFAQVRNGDGNKMPAFNRGEIPDSYLLHLWTWLKEKPTS